MGSRAFVASAGGGMSVAAACSSLATEGAVFSGCVDACDRLRAVSLHPLRRRQ
jgi:hypothetical protein